MAWGFWGFASKPQGDGPPRHVPQAIPDALRGGDPLTGGDGQLDAGQFLEEATTGGNDEAIVLHRTGAGLQDPAIGAQAGGGGGQVVDPQALDKAPKGQAQVLRPAQTRGNPNDPGEILEFRLGTDQGDLDTPGLGEGADGGQGGKTGADDGDSGHGASW